MARPRRPDAERDLVLAAIGDTKLSARAAATRLAEAVTAAAIREINREPDELIDLLASLNTSPTYRLATDPEIDAMALVRSERAARLHARGGRRLREREWQAEDAEIATVVAATLARRYARHLRLCA